ncbi:hypothetical protein CkaCkLH20_10570 [Colletotrichum karsti]|uniref:Fungal N-terminal domain-containing protein n=1 Tax=Colletotrichum karsti TaxID=1095194 RepID=A0A9P6HW62_9PEZI|nr:uncharacterized protein CkaCkLH20_10570 [Colletotrichum karsti]KAF9871938.1 hypothetical protein CkaCkLH20_10570 [Colletotrichum karsti]
MADPGNSTARPACTCPDPSDSNLSIAGNILGIVTFVTTTIAIAYSYVVVVTGFSKNLSDLVRNVEIKALELVSLRSRINTLSEAQDMQQAFPSWHGMLGEVQTAYSALDFFKSQGIFEDRFLRATHDDVRVFKIYEAFMGSGLLAGTAVWLVEECRRLWRFFSLASLRKFRLINGEEPKAKLSQAENAIQTVKSFLSYAESSIVLDYQLAQRKELNSLSTETGEIRKALKELSEQVRLLAREMRQRHDNSPTREGEGDEGARDSIRRVSEDTGGFEGGAW